MSGNPVVLKARRARQLARFYKVQRLQGFTPPVKPHLDPATLDTFYRLLDGAALYLEFGCGGSTKLAGEMKVPTVSVESDRYYAAVVRKCLSPDADVEIIDANIGLTCEWGRPVFKKPTERRAQRWRSYVDLPVAEVHRRAIQPDLILVDGRFRRACAIAAALLVSDFPDSGRETTLLFDDYVPRRHYHSIEGKLGKPEIVGRSAIFRLTPEVGRGIDPSVVQRFCRDAR